MAEKIYFFIYIAISLAIIYMTTGSMEKFKSFPYFKIITLFYLFVYMFSKLFAQKFKEKKNNYSGYATYWAFIFLLISQLYAVLIIPDFLNSHQSYVFVGLLPIVNAFYINFLVQTDIGHKINHKKNAILLLIFNLYIWITFLFFSF